MNTIRKALRRCIPVACMLALFAGPAAAALTVDGDFNASGSYSGTDDPSQASSVALRTNGAGQDWYESRASVPQKVMLYSNTTDGVYGNYTNMARFRYSQPSYTGTGYAYLTQEFSSVQTGRFSVTYDIAVGFLANTDYDRTGMMYIGTDSGGAGGPNKLPAERFVSLGFYDPGQQGGSGGTGRYLNLIANNSTNVTPADSLLYDTWYTITIDVDVAGRTYDVTVDDKYGTETYYKLTGITANANLGSLSHLSFAVGTEEQGTFYVDNATAVPIPAAAWLLGSGLLGLVAIRRRMKK